MIRAEAFGNLGLESDAALDDAKKNLLRPRERHTSRQKPFPWQKTTIHASLDPIRSDYEITRTNQLVGRGRSTTRANG